MTRDSDGVRSISGYNPKEKTDAEKVESCTKEIARLENLLDAQKRILASAEKRLEQASKMSSRTLVTVKEGRRWVTRWVDKKED